MFEIDFSMPEKDSVVFGLQVSWLGWRLPGVCRLRRGPRTKDPIEAILILRIHSRREVCVTRIDDSAQKNAGIKVVVVLGVHGRGPRPGDGDPRTQEKLAIIAGIGRKDKSPFPLELVTSAQINFSGHHVRMQMVLPWTVLLE